MSQSIGGCRKFCRNVWVDIAFIPFVFANHSIVLRTKEYGHEIFHNNLLKEPNHVVSCDLEDGFVVELGIFVQNFIAKTVMLARKDCMKTSENRILNSSSVTGSKKAIKHRQKLLPIRTFTVFKFAVFELSQSTISISIRSIDLACINP